jgi:hypothetical protein
MKNLGACFDGRFVVYRFYDADDRLLYVGSTSRLPMRMVSHQKNSAWWPQAARVAWCLYPTLSWARHAESCAIAFELPRYNIVGQLGEATRNDPQMMAQLRRFYASTPVAWSAAA